MPKKPAKSAAPERFFIDQDISSHWYLVPFSKIDEWTAWTEIDGDDEASWIVPPFAKAIDGPDGITFTDPQT